MLSDIQRPVSASVVKSIWRSIISSHSQPLPSLVLNYDEGTSTVSVNTTGAGRLYWAIFGAAGATAGDIVSGVGASDFGFVDTLPGTVGIDLPALVPGVETWLACTFLPAGGAVYSTSEVRTQAPSVLTYATVSGTTGSPTVYDYVDGDGTWRAYEFLTAGSITLSTAGDVEHLIIAGGGGGGGASYQWGGGGGAGGLLAGTNTRTAGTYPITVGTGGLGGYGSVQPEPGLPSTVFGLTAVGGGSPDESVHTRRNGGSGSGRRAGFTDQGTGVAGQGFAGGSAVLTGGGSGGGGAGGVGGDSKAPGGGNGGVGIDSSILGVSKGFAGGGSGGSDTTTGATASHGAATLGSRTTARKGGDGTDGTGAGGGGSVATSTAATNRGGKGGNGAVIIRVRLA